MISHESIHLIFPLLTGSFNWSLSDIKFSLVSTTLLSIQADFSSAVVRRVLAFSLISDFPGLFSMPLKTAPRIQQRFVSLSLFERFYPLLSKIRILMAAWRRNQSSIIKREKKSKLSVHSCHDKQKACISECISRQGGVFDPNRPRVVPYTIPRFDVSLHSTSFQL